MTVLLYLVVIHQGPKLMSNYNPFDLKKALVVYNFGLVLLSSYMVFEVKMQSKSFSTPVFFFLEIGQNIFYAQYKFRHISEGC